MLFQAQKKVSGNTHTARGMPMNIAAFVFVLGGGFIAQVACWSKLWYGRGKIVLKE